MKIKIMSSEEEDEWIKIATNDDKVVAELLLRLRSQQPNFLPPLPPPPLQQQLPPLCCNWSVRQRRSRQVSWKKTGEASSRGSPTTPLSWSEATSASGGVSVAEEPIDDARSKTGNAATTTETPVSKKGRKKKSITELREAENALLKERINLKSELAMLRCNFEKERARNESFKRMKLDVLSQPTTQTVIESVSTREAPLCQSRYTLCSISHDLDCRKLVSKSCIKTHGSEKEPPFMLPDLNLLAEDELCA